jgi:chorismate mutase
MTELDLSVLREQIDRQDRSLLELLSQRMQVVELVGQYKREHSLAPLDPSRWQQVLTKRHEWADELGLDQSLVTDIFNLIHHHALKMEAGQIKPVE